MAILILTDHGQTGRNQVTAFLLTIQELSSGGTNALLRDALAGCSVEWIYSTSLGNYDVTRLFEFHSLTRFRDDGSLLRKFSDILRGFSSSSQ